MSSPSSPEFPETPLDPAAARAALLTDFDILKPALRRAGWLDDQFPPPRFDLLRTPNETIPLLWSELPPGESFHAVFALTLPPYLPQPRTISGWYLDLPYLCRALPAMLEAPEPTNLRLFLLSEHSAWYFSGARDQALPLDAREPELDPRRLEGSHKWWMAPREEHLSDESAEQLRATELAGWLRRWEEELGPELPNPPDPLEPELSRRVVTRRLLWTLALCRMRARLAGEPETPIGDANGDGAWPPCRWTQPDAPEPRWPGWDAPFGRQAERVRATPEEWLPRRDRWLKRLEYWDADSRGNSALARAARRLLEEWELLSDRKFDPEVFTRALCSEEESRLAWKVAIMSPVRVPVAVSATLESQRETIHVDLDVEGPGRLGEWVAALTRHWKLFLQSELVDRPPDEKIPVQVDLFDHDATIECARDVMAYRMFQGIARSLRVDPRDANERERLRAILTALALRVAHGEPEFRDMRRNLCPYWLGETRIADSR